MHTVAALVRNMSSASLLLGAAFEALAASRLASNRAAMLLPTYIHTYTGGGAVSTRCNKMRYDTIRYDAPLPIQCLAVLSYHPQYNHYPYHQYHYYHHYHYHYSNYHHASSSITPACLPSPSKPCRAMSCDCDSDCDCGPSVVLALPSDEVVFASLTLIARSESLRSERARMHVCIPITIVCMRQRSAVTHPPIEAAAAAAESPSMPSTSLRSSAWKLADEDEEDEDGAKGRGWGSARGNGRVAGRHR